LILHKEFFRMNAERPRSTEVRLGGVRMRYEYPAILEFETDGRVTAYFDGLPGATWGRTVEEALARAQDLLVNALEMLIEDGEPLPTPSPANGRPVVEDEL
jgi:antitoxin HicB